MKAWIQNLSDFQFSLLCIGLMVAGLFCLQLAFTSQTLRDMVDDAEKVVRDRMRSAEAQHVPIELPVEPEATPPEAPANEEAE